MKLQNKKLKTAEELGEFDQWLTPRLERIKDSDRFKSEIESLCKCISAIGPYLNDFSDFESCRIGNLCEAVISAGYSFVEGQSFIDDESRVADFYGAFFNLLFLTTGATDNNLKNHFLIKLKQDSVKSLIPKRYKSKNKVRFILEDIPSTTKSDFIASRMASCFVGSHESYTAHVITEPLFDLKIYLQLMLREYVGLILEDEEEVIQLWAVCRSYVALNQLQPDLSLGKFLLNSCTIFKVRGSVSATGGHITEDILRDYLISMGLRPDSDFNTNDVTIGEEEIVENGRRKKKTRAYDFILPYKIDNWEPKPKLFIQSQFYAGDSGSLSHKVVDQTQSSRLFTLGKYPTARFVEYLDGAGYYAALRGDLEHMLSLDDTHSFFQVKSILIRLRRELQNIEFLTPIELEHAILTSGSGLKVDVFNSLEIDGYPKDEIERSSSISIGLKYIYENNGTLEIAPERVEIARRLLIVDIAANNSSSISYVDIQSQKYLLVPGFGADYGILESRLSELVCSICRNHLIGATEFLGDIEWLLDQGVFKRR